jgi:hypothetical protein
MTKSTCECNDLHRCMQSPERQRPKAPIECGLDTPPRIRTGRQSDIYTIPNLRRVFGGIAKTRSESACRCSGAARKETPICPEGETGEFSGCTLGRSMLSDPFCRGWIRKFGRKSVKSRQILCKLFIINTLWRWTQSGANRSLDQIPLCLAKTPCVNERREF